MTGTKLKVWRASGLFAWRLIVVVACLGNASLIKANENASVSIQRVATDEAVEELLGLEPSELAQLKSQVHWSSGNRFLNIALTYLEQVPFRRIPVIVSVGRTGSIPQPTTGQLPAGQFPAGIRLVQGSLLKLVRYGTPVVGSRRENDQEILEPGEGLIYECLLKDAQISGQPLAGTPDIVRVLTRTIPKHWDAQVLESLEPGTAVWQPDKTVVTVRAIVVDLGFKTFAKSDSDDEHDSATEDRPQYLTGLAKRLEWPEGNIEPIVELLRAEMTGRDSSTQGELPADQQAKAILATATDWSRWGQVGFDLGLFPLLAGNQRRPLASSDNEPFYQLLNAVSAEQLPASTTSTTDADLGVGGAGLVNGLPIQDLIRQPQNWVGRSFQTQVIVKQVTRVPCEPNDRAQQLGITHYYLLHGLAPLSRPLRLKIDAERQLDYQRQFPVVIAVRDLPLGLTVGDENRQWVQSQVVFFKLWSYQSQRSQQAGVDQWAPLLIGESTIAISPPSEGNSNWPIGWLLLIPLGLSLIFLFVYGIKKV